MVFFSKIKKRLHKLICGTGVTPLPFLNCLLLFLIQLLASMTITMAFSFLPQLVKSFNKDEINTGTFAGLIGSALFLGRFISSSFWGHLCDKKGKKFVTIVSSILLILATVMFGFSKNLYWALSSRFLQGCCMGMNVAVKAIMGDMTDDTNQAFGMSIIMCSYTTGLVLGPCIGAFLSFPTKLYPESFSPGSLYGEFQVLLPNLILVIAYIIVTIIGWYYLPDDKRDTAGEKQSLVMSSPTHKKYCEVQCTNDSENFCHVILTEKKLEFNPMATNSDDNAGQTYFLLLESIKHEAQVAPCCCSRPIKTSSKLNEMKICVLIRKKESLLACILYGTYAIVGIGYDEMFPLFAATAKNYGGFGFDSIDIGTALLLVSITSMFIEIPMHTKLTKRFGAKKMFISCTLLQSFFFPMHVTLANIKNREIFWALLFMILFATRICIDGSFLNATMFLNNSVEPDWYGTINGLAITFSTFCRTLTPSFFGSIFSWSLHHVKGIQVNKDALGFPFNQYFPFYVMAIVAIFNALLVNQFPEEIDNRKVRKTNIKEEQEDPKEGQC